MVYFDTKLLLFLDTLTSLHNLNSTHTSEKRVKQSENNTWVGRSILQNTQLNHETRITLLDQTTRRFSKLHYTAPSRSAYFSGTRMMLYLVNWDWLHQQTVRSLLLWFGIVTTDQTRAEMSVQNILCKSLSFFYRCCGNAWICKLEGSKISKYHRTNNQKFTAAIISDCERTQLGRPPRRGDLLSDFVVELFALDSGPFRSNEL